MPFYYAYEYGHINRGWNARGLSSTRPRAFLRKTAKQIELYKLDKNIVNNTVKSLEKAILKASRK